MPELAQVLSALAPALGDNYSVFLQIVKGTYCVSSGGVTMKNMARWTDKGGSYRTIQRFFSRKINWLELNTLLLLNFWLTTSNPGRYVLAVDEVVEDKAGKHTYGVNWFFSSIAGKVIRAISHHVVTLVDTEKERSFVLKSQQTVKGDEKVPKRKKGNGKKPGKKKKGGLVPKKSKSPKNNPSNPNGAKGQAGRPKGSLNKQNVKEDSLLYNSFEGLLRAVLPLLSSIGLGIRYVLGDGAYGNKTCVLIVRELGLELISKLNRNTALFLPGQGPYPGKGRHKKYGEKLDCQKLSNEYLVKTETDNEEKTQLKTYQVKGVWTKHMPCLLNVVILVKTDLQSKKVGRVILFSTDLDLDAATLVRYYSLRFHIEFNFRDAKQYFGLSDLKNVKEQQVENAVNLAFFMDNLSLILIEEAKELWQSENVSIQDLKAQFRADKYLRDILNALELDEKTILNKPEIAAIRQIGAIHQHKIAA